MFTKLLIDDSFSASLIAEKATLEIELKYIALIKER